MNDPIGHSANAIAVAIREHLEAQYERNTKMCGIDPIAAYQDAEDRTGRLIESLLDNAILRLQHRAAQEVDFGRYS